jgi:hypothetical protein
MGSAHSKLNNSDIQLYKGNLPYLNATINNHSVDILYDTGAMISVIDKKLFEKVSKDVNVYLRPNVKQVMSVTNSVINSTHSCTLDLKIDNRVISYDFYIFSMSTAEMIVGMDFITRHRIGFCPADKKFYWAKSSNVFDRDFTMPVRNPYSKEFYYCRIMFEGTNFWSILILLNVYLKHCIIIENIFFTILSDTNLQPNNGEDTDGFDNIRLDIQPPVEPTVTGGNQSGAGEVPTAVPFWRKMASRFRKRPPKKDLEEDDSKCFSNPGNTDKKSDDDVEGTQGAQGAQGAQGPSVSV